MLFRLPHYTFITFQSRRLNAILHNFYFISLYTPQEKHPYALRMEEIQESLIISFNVRVINVFSIIKGIILF